MEQYPWSVSVKAVDGEVVVDEIISFDDEKFPEGTWILDATIWATEHEAHFVAQKRIRTKINQRAKHVIWQIGNLDRLYSVKEFLELMAV